MMYILTFIVLDIVAVTGFCWILKKTMDRWQRNDATKRAMLTEEGS